MTPNGEISCSLLSYQFWLHLVRHCWVFPIHVLETGHVAGLGLFGSGAAYDYRWLSVTYKQAWTDLWRPPARVIL
jgi:hypothetical protein